MIPFNINEVIAIAEQIERNGAEFYHRAADKTTDDGARKLLLDLASDEEDHLKTLAGMKEKVRKSENEATAFDPNDEAGLYLQAFASGHIFDPDADLCAMLTTCNDTEEILKYAVQVAKDAVVFYVGLRRLVPERLGKAKVCDLVEDEARHVALLGARLAESG